MLIYLNVMLWTIKPHDALLHLVKFVSKVDPTVATGLNIVSDKVPLYPGYGYH